ncbi:tRNA modification GTPase TrmE [Ramaria rubella]|nr:tRNA modification GTPase TrmE [Ramaria rubella]
MSVLRHTLKLGRCMTTRGVHLASITRSPSENKTIYALSTPPGKGGVAVVRVSGPEAAIVWRRVVRPLSVKRQKKDQSIPRSRLMQRCHVVETDTEGAEEILDDGLAVFFQAPKSFTTESTLELHLHSSPATLRRVLSALSRMPGLRPAERGEFTKRAYLAGRISLLEAEGLRDLIDAETEIQRRVAWGSFGGSVEDRFEYLREQIVGALAMVEALIDFGEGEEIEEGVYEGARRRVESLRGDIINHLQDNRRGEILRSGIKVSIFGPPNAGKSSLLNYLAQRDAAIVTPIPGTTRDVLETSLDIAGLPVRLLDTAGIRNTEDLVEKIGIERAQKAVQDADISLCILSFPQFLEEGQVPPSVETLITPNTLVLFNKEDLVTTEAATPTLGGKSTWKVSLATGAGISEFVKGLGKVLNERYDFREDDAPLITQNRHRVHLQNAVLFLDTFLRTSGEEIVVAAEELRYASQEIGKITGRVGVEDVLDTVFREFCIGK